MISIGSDLKQTLAYIWSCRIWTKMHEMKYGHAGNNRRSIYLSGTFISYSINLTCNLWLLAIIVHTWTGSLAWAHDQHFNRIKSSKNRSQQKHNWHTQSVLPKIAFSWIMQASVYNRYARKTADYVLKLAYCFQITKLTTP